MNRAHVCRLAALLLCSSLTAQPSPVWTIVSTSGPSPRDFSSLAYDSTRNEMVLFGGQTFNGYNGDTWILSGNAWTQRTGIGPSPRIQAAMAYDKVRQVIILFGGYTMSGPSDETWSWNSGQWTLLRPGQSPMARSGARMAYDEARQKIVLFGGASASLPSLADTWEWNGIGWTPRFSAHVPPPRYMAGMTYDRARGTVLLFGGANGTSNPPPPDLWSWNGLDWIAKTNQINPGSLFAPAMAYHPGRQITVHFSGDSGSNGNWLWDSANWKSVILNGPVQAAGGSMAYHEAQDAILFYGGMNSPTNTSTWKLTIAPFPGGFTPLGLSCGPSTVLAAKSGTATRIGATFDAEVRNIPTAVSAATMWVGASKTLIGAFPLPLSLYFAGMPGCWLYQDLLVPQPLAIASGLGTWSLQIPLQAPLVGVHLYLQGMLALPGANPAGVVVTNGADLWIGGF